MAAAVFARRCDTGMLYIAMAVTQRDTCDDVIGSIRLFITDLFFRRLPSTRRSFSFPVTVVTVTTMLLYHHLHISHPVILLLLYLYIVVLRILCGSLLTCLS